MSDNISTEKKDRKIDNLINIVENHTRTERHLEQYSHIGNPEYKNLARDKQKIREEEINNLKAQLSGENTKKISIDEQIENIEDNYSRSNEYLQNNFENMPQDAINNLYAKQKQRLEQLNTLYGKDDTKNETF